MSNSDSDGLTYKDHRAYIVTDEGGHFYAFCICGYASPSGDRAAAMMAAQGHTGSPRGTL